MNRFLLAVLVVALPHVAMAQDAPNTSRGDKLLDGYFRAQVKQISAACLSDVQTLQDWQKKRPELKRQLLDMLGLWPLPPRGDLKATVTGKVDAEHFTIEKLHFQSIPGLYVTANLYVPKKAKFPAPAILYVCGHASTIKDKVSFGHHVNYQHHPAWFAEHGYVCLIIDSLEFGEAQGIHHGTHHLGHWWWHNLGYTPAGIETWNGVRALDYLTSRKEVDAKRIGVTGRSGGGAYSWYIAAVDERVQCAVPVAGIADLRAHVVEGVAPRFKKGVVSGHCDCMYMVNTYRWDFPQVAALIAPRPLLLVNTDKDDIFPVPAYRDLAKKVKRIYELHGAGDNFEVYEGEGPHKDTPELRKGEYGWMNRWLKNDRGPIEEPERAKFPPEQLKVFDRVPEDAINAQVHELFIKPAQTELPMAPEVVKQWWPRKKQEWMQALKDRVFSGWTKTPPPLNAKAGADITHDGVRLRAFDFTSEEAVELRLWVLTAPKIDRPTMIHTEVLREEDWKDWLTRLGPEFKGALQADGDITRDADKFDQLRKSLAFTKWAIVLVAPRGIGPTRWDTSEKYAENHIKRRFALLGQTLDGQRVWDVRRALEAVRGLTDLKGKSFRLQGEKDMAGVALYAALFEPDVMDLTLPGLASSHKDGPYLLNVARVLDMPQAVALAMPRRIRIPVLFQLSEREWEWPLQLQRALGQESLKISFGSN